MALIHSGSGGASGTFEQSKEAMANYEKQVRKMREYIMVHTSIDKKTMTKNQAKDWYLDADEQVKYGIVDKIADDIDEFN